MKNAITVVFFRSASGRNPVGEFLKALPAAEHARMVEMFLRIERFGLDQAGVTVRFIAPGLSELKPSGFRFLFAREVTRELWVLHGFRKQHAKLPDADRELALRRLAEWKARLGIK